MKSTPSLPSRQSIALTPADVEATERELVDLLQKALSPSFVLVRRLGAGGMGIVYLARDPALKRLVAVKVMSPERAFDPEARARFQREAEAVAAISHPNVVAVYSVGTLENGLPYLVMQYVDGPTMSDRLLQEGPLDLETAKQVIGQVASALDAAHRKGIIHRDIKSANILWDDHAGRALVSDFGIASILEHDFDGKTLRLTQTGVVLGTPRYMSPEQLLAEPVTEKTDIYSLGLLGYELLTGEGPYDVGTAPNAILAAHLKDPPRPLTTVRPDADPVLESILAGCLTKDAASRPSAEDVARRLQHGASILLEWPPPGLEVLPGAATKPIRQLLWGSLALSVPLTLVATTDASNPLRLGFPGVLIYPIMGSMGAVAAAAALVRGVQLLRASLKAARAGYGWGLITEVLVDPDKDTGAVIVGEREYASLSVEQRNDIRRWRLRRWTLLGAAGVWAVLAPFIGLPVAVRLSFGPMALALWTLLVPVVAMVSANEAGRRERRILEPVRARLRKHRQPLERLSFLAATWKDSFDRLAQGVMRGQGAIGGVTRRAVTAAAVAGAIGLGAFATVGLLAMATVGEVAMSRTMPVFTTVRTKIRRVSRLATLRPALDPALTPIDAGMAIRTLSESPRFKDELIGPPLQHPLAELPSMPPEPRGVFDRYWLDGSAMRAAAHHLTPAQRAFVEKLAAVPGEAQMRILAHTAAVDYVGAVVPDPVPAGLTIFALPIPRFSYVKAAAAGHIGRAMLALDEGRPVDAERYLRETLGAGFAMMDDPLLIDDLIGAVIVNQARSNLVALYEVTGRAAEARPISASTDPADETLDTDYSHMDRAAQLALVMSTIRDAQAPRGTRWEVTSSRLAYEPCTDLRQIIFGPSAQHLKDMAEARRLLVHTRGEAVLMDLADRAIETQALDAGIPISPVHRGVGVLAKGIDLLTGSKRMQACISTASF
jgi:serine/threonine-protein kinase